MRASLAYNEVGGMIVPNSIVSNLQYGNDYKRTVLNRSKSADEPDKYFHYQSLSTSIIQIAIENATGKKISVYLKEKLWDKLGMQYNGYLSTDKSKERSNKAFANLGITPIDLAKLGKLYLNNGKWNGEQIVPLWMVKKVRNLDYPMNGYFYAYSFRHNRDWSTLKEWEKKNGKYNKNLFPKTELIRKGNSLFIAEPKALEDQDFYTEGLLGNYVYVHPKSNTIIVRTGNDFTMGFVAWPQLFRAIVKNENHIKNTYNNTTRLREVKQ